MPNKREYWCWRADDEPHCAVLFETWSPRWAAVDFAEDSDRTWTEDVGTFYGVRVVLRSECPQRPTDDLNPLLGWVVEVRGVVVEDVESRAIKPMWTEP